VADMKTLFDTLTWEQISDDTGGVIQVPCSVNARQGGEAHHDGFLTACRPLLFAGFQD